MDNSVIKVKDLYKIYTIGTNKVRALNGVDFTIRRGEFCCIVGTSGSGKSTLLNMLAGLEKPTKGEVVIAGEHIEKKNESQLVQFRQEHVGFIFQSYNLMPNMDAIENVAMPLIFQGVGRKERKERAIEMLKLVGLSKYMDHRPGQMSGGQQQRVGIARALVVNPEIVFADEPTGNLDSRTTMEVLKLIQKISREKNQTMVMVTHDNNLASYGDRIIRISDGKIIKITDNAKRKKEEAAAKKAAETAKKNIWDEVEETGAGEAKKTKAEEAETKGTKAEEVKIEETKEIKAEEKKEDKKSVKEN
ncbi:MAG: ABC transporter ATP-binding protein [Lachnospiraceae bacterium]|nr:ABC transporter ATP-binding protein [Lachnospiraceae bacterium]